MTRLEAVKFLMLIRDSGLFRDEGKEKLTIIIDNLIEEENGEDKWKEE